MKEKLILAYNMNTFVNNSRNPKNKKTLKKCFWQIIKQYIIFGKEEFKIRYGSKYYDSFNLRFKDWMEYITNIIIVPFWKLIPNQKYRPGIINYYIKHGVPKPIHLKMHIFVNESILEYFLQEFGFRIVDEHLGSLETIYYIKRK